MHLGPSVNSVDILLVDDREENLLALEAALSNPEYRFIRASSGREALKVIESQSCALILLDVQMPEMDGFETAREIRRLERGREIPIIFVTAIHRDEAYISRGYTLGAVDYLFKPLDIRVLRAKVAAFVAIYRQSESRVGFAMENQKKWLESTLDLLPTPMLLVEPGTTQVLFANQAAQRLAGGDFARFSEIIVGEKLEAHEMAWSTPEGPISVICSSEKLPARFGHPETLVVMFQDVSQLKQVETELQEALLARDEFLSVASHELKTPITSLRLQLQMLARSPDASEMIKNRMITAEKQVKRMTALINDLLDVTRMRNRKLQYEFEPGNLTNLVRELPERFFEELKAAGLELTVNVQGEAEGVWDWLRMEQALTNLITNAIRYGNGKPIAVKLEVTSHEVMIAVQDQGIGIAAEDHVKIFNRFEQARSQAHADGLGLGLYIVKQIVDAHGGVVTVESESGKGSVFTMRLPIRSGMPGLATQLDQSAAKPKTSHAT